MVGPGKEEEWTSVPMDMRGLVNYRYVSTLPWSTHALSIRWPFPREKG